MADTPAESSSRLERLERIYEENPETRLFLALAEEYFRDGQLEKAVEVCRSGLKTYPGYTSARVTLARSLIDLGQDDEAEEALQTVLKNSPDNLVATRLNAGLLVQRGRTDEARAELERLLALSPDDEAGLRLHKQLDEPEASGHEPAREAKPAPGAEPFPEPVPEPEPFPGPDPAPADAGDAPQLKTLTLARLYEEQGLYDKAIGVYETLLARDPDNREMAERAAGLRARLDSTEPAPPRDGTSRRKVEALGRLLDAARALSPERTADE